MIALGVIHDPVYDRTKEPKSLDRYFSQFINDVRDLPFIYLSIKITFIVIPFAIFLFTDTLQGSRWWFAAVAYTVLIIYFVGPYTLMLHNTSHRRFFKPQYNFLNYYIPCVLAPFMGQSPMTYFGHHIGMHHVENNLEHDKSSTMKYKRDSLVDFLKYTFRFLFIGVPELLSYFKQKKATKLYNMVFSGETLYFLGLLVLAFFNLKATLYLMVVTMLIVRFMMMAGNWGQHAFVDQNEPANNYKNSITCINTAYNKKCFNDGYHIGHHLRANMHWTEMPKEFEQNSKTYGDQNAIVFSGLDFHMVWGCLMLKQYNFLASRFVNLNGRMKNKEEVIALLKAQTRKFD